MFTHVAVVDVIASLLWLWGFGFILQSLTGNDKLIPLYLYGGLIGGVVFLIVNNTIPALKANSAAQFALAGGGASIMTIAIATTISAFHHPTAAEEPHDAR